MAIRRELLPPSDLLQRWARPRVHNSAVRIAYRFFDARAINRLPVSLDSIARTCYCSVHDSEG